MKFLTMSFSAVLISGCANHQHESDDHGYVLSSTAQGNPYGLKAASQ